MEIHVILGGPGCNKTGLLTELYAKAVSEYGWNKVAFISYTVAQVRRDKAKVKSVTKLTQDKLDAFRTIHSAARQHYKEETIVMPEREFDGMSVFMDIDMTDIYKGIDYMSQLETKNMAVGANKAGLDTDNFKKCVYFYNKVKEKKSLNGVKVIDFSDMLKDAVNAHYKIDVDCAFVDECQDLTPLQWRAIYTFFRDVKHLYVAGDPNQAIYRFNGGSTNYMLNMRYDDIKILNQSKRCSADVMEMAFLIWKQMTNAVEMPMSNGDNSGFGVFYPERKLRNNFKSAIERVLNEGKTVMVIATTYFQLLKMRDDILNNDLNIPHNFLSGRCKYHYEDRKKNVITFSTVHQAKGSEADYVIFDVSYGGTSIKHEYGSLEDRWQDYYRMIYTGITRARKGIVLCEISTPVVNQPSCKKLLYYSNFGMENYRKWLNASSQDNTLSFDRLQLCSTK